MSRSGFTHPRQDMRFSNENVQLLGGKLYGRIFTQRELSSRRECYPDFASRQDSHQDPGEEFFSWEFSPGRIPPGKRATSAGSRRDPGERRESWRDPGEIPVPILQGLSLFVIVVAHKATIKHQFCRFLFDTASAERKRQLVILSERQHWMIELVGR